MLNRLKRMLPHAAILIGNMYLVFYLIDRVNKAMNFIDNGLTKGLLLALCVLALINARRLSRTARRQAARDGAGLRRAKNRRRRPDKAGRERREGR